MSRVCVKGVPEYVTEARLREMFKKSGVITDVKVLVKKDGTARHMAFIGFKDDASAASAVKYFNRSFLDTFQLKVEIARSIREDAAGGKETASKKRKPDGKGDGKGVGKGKAAKTEPAAPPKTASEKLKEFLALMKTRNAKATWSNDDAKVDRTKNKVPKKKKGKADSDDAASSGDSEGESGSEDGSGKEEEEEKAAASGSSDSESSGEEAGPAAAKKARRKHASDDAEDVGESGRLFVRNLAYTATEGEVTAAFARFGKLSSVHLAVDELKRSKGFACVAFHS